MSTQAPNIFTSFNLSDEEVLAAFDIPILTLQALQNLRSNAAIERLNLAVDSLNPTLFMQQEASLKGQMDILSHILDLVDTTQKSKSNSSQ